MNLLDIDFQSIRTPIIDAFTFVYGEKYRDIISKKINNTYFISYFDIDGMESYVYYLRNCKGKELSLRFLDAIGVSTCYDRSNYSHDFDSDTEEVLNSTISIDPFSEYRNVWSPLCAFDENNQEHENRLQVNRLKVINYLLQEKGKQISIDQLTSFMESDEYQEIYEKIEKYRNIYNDLLEEYYEWEKSLSPYLEFIDKEKKRKNRIYEENKHELFSTIYPLLPEAVRNHICDKDFLEQERIVLGNLSIDFPTIIESFSKTNMNKLRDPNGNTLEEFGFIKYDQRNYFNQLDILLPFGNLFYCDTNEKVASYLDFLEEEKIQQYIPSQNAISFIERCRKKKEEDAFLEYLSNRSDYQKIAIKFFHFPSLLNEIQLIIKNKVVCVTGTFLTDENREVFPFLCYAIRRDFAGVLDFSLLHEAEHVIDKRENGCGLEPHYTFDDDFWRNPYDKRFRTYEKFNEALNDIFVIEALEYLHKNNIYMLEPREIVQLDFQNFNTHLFTKKLLFPLVEKFREEVIAAKINAEPSILTQSIGEDNYEALVDTVNKVDYLCRNGLSYELEHSPDSVMCKEYQEQLKRAADIYTAIDEYSIKSSSNSSNFEKNKTRKNS